MRERICSSKLQFRPRSRFTFFFSRAFVSCLGCQHFISDWLGKLKPNKLSTGCQNELKGAAVEKATNPGRRFLFFSRLRRSFSRASRANFGATPLLRPARQNRHATQATYNFFATIAALCNNMPRCKSKIQLSFLLNCLHHSTL